MSKGIDFLNKYQIKALENGTTMLWIPIDKEYIRYRVKELSEPVEPYIEFEYSIKDKSPLQIGQEYYVQEEFRTIKKVARKYSRVIWAIKNTWGNTHKSTTIYKNNSLGTKPKIWQDASEMQEHQSRFKFRVTNIQVKQLYCLEYKHLLGLGVDDTPCIVGQNQEEEHQWKKDACFQNFYKIWSESYPELPWETNPYGFLVTIERINR